MVGDGNSESSKVSASGEGRSQPRDGGNSDGDGSAEAGKKAIKKKATKKRATKKKATTKKADKKKVPKKKAPKKKAPRTPKKKAAKGTVEAELGLLPKKALVLTDAEGRVAGVLPKHALVLVKRGIAREGGLPLDVDPRPTQKAFMWLTGREQGEGLPAGVAHHRLALRLVEYLVRATVMGDPEGQRIIEDLYRQVRRCTPLPRSGASSWTAPLSRSDLGMVITLPNDSEEE